MASVQPTKTITVSSVPDKDREETESVEASGKPGTTNIIVHKRDAAAAGITFKVMNN